MFYLLQKRGSRRRSSIFPTIVENDEPDGENQEEGNMRKDCSPNELSPYFLYNKDARSSSTHSGRKISSGTKFTFLVQSVILLFDSFKILKT